MKLLIAYDGSECADGALEDLRRAGLPADVQALVLSVADVWPHLPASAFQASDAGSLAPLSPTTRRARDLARQALAEARALAVQAAERVRALFPQWQVEHEACADSAPGGVLQRAEKWGADLILVGSQGRSALGRMVFGSVSQRILSYAACSVRVARRRSPAVDNGPVRLIIGVDGSSGAAEAVRAMAARRWPAGSEARILSALDTRLRTAIPIEETGDAAGGRDELAWLQRAVDEAEEQLRSAGLVTARRLVEGDPRRVLLEEADRWGADCIFLGAKGLSRLERFLLGSVSAAVAARASCSVEVVRPHPATAGVS